MNVRTGDAGGGQDIVRARGRRDRVQVAEGIRGLKRAVSYRYLGKALFSTRRPLILALGAEGAVTGVTRGVDAPVVLLEARALVTPAKVRTVGISIRECRRTVWILLWFLCSDHEARSE